VWIDEARRQDQAFGIDDSFRRSWRNNFPARNADIFPPHRRARAVRDEGVLD
jgi:hypothetical protein